MSSSLMERVLDACPDRVLPRGKTEADLTWGWRLNGVDMRSTHDYRWPHPGRWAKAGGPFFAGHECPSTVGDGICVALTLAGAQSGGASLYRSTGVLVGYLADDVLGSSKDKVRVKRAWVADTFDAFRAICVRGADLSYADLSYADLSYANLSDADPSYANLRYANLSDADLSYADLSYANLRYANLSYADLSYADLRYADLRYAVSSPSTVFPAGFNKSRLG